MKISRNPAQAYLQGKEDGRKDGVNSGFIAFSYLCLLAMNNVNTEVKWLSNKRFKEFFILTEKELNRLFTEDFRNDVDNVTVAMHYVNNLREKLGLEKII